MLNQKKKANPVDVHVGARVRMRRLMLGMSQEKLGDALGLTFQQVQKYEKGTNRIGASRLRHIADILKCDTSAFFEGAPNPDGSRRKAGEQVEDYTVGFLATTLGLRLCKVFMHMTKGQQTAFVDLAEEVANVKAN